MKKSLSVILAVVFVIGVCFSAPFTIQSNAAGVGDLTFSLNEDGKSYCVSGYSESVSVELVIPSTYNDLPVTSIGSHAFEDCFALTSVIIPDSVTSIGDYAFNSCIALTSATIPDSVTTIGEGAFYYCVVLTSITIPDSVTSIGESAFGYCHDLENVTLGNGITGLSNLMFAGCSSLASITIPDSVTTIGGGAFYECTKLTHITIPDNVTIIDEVTFYYCRNLISITIPDSVTNIHDTAFENCSKELVFIVDNNDYVIEYSEKNNFNYVLNSNNQEAFVFELNEDGQSYSVVGHNLTNETELVIPSTYNDLPVTSIGNEAFKECISITSVIISDGVKSIGDYAFNDCVSLTSVTIPDSLTSIGEGAFYHCPVLTSISIPDSVTNIGESAFYYCYDLESVTIGNGITSISDFMFAECMSLTSITIPDNVTSIGAGAFYECIKLANVTIPNNVTTIGEVAFYYCRDLTSLTLPNNVTNIGDDAFANCSQELVLFINNNDYLIEYLEKNNLNYTFKSPLVFELNDDGESYYVSDCDTSASGELVIPSTYNGLPVTSIGEETFYGCTSLTSVTLPDSVTSIGNFAFVACYSLSSMTIPESVMSMGAYTFYDCTSLTSITIPDSITSIGYDAFAYCNQLKKVNVSDIEKWCNIDFGSEAANPLSNGAGLYLDGKIIRNLILPDNLTEVKNYTFYGNRLLKSVKLPDTIEKIGISAFGNCANLELFVMSKNVTDIESCAFDGCSSLESVVIPKTLKNVGYGAFHPNDGLKYVFYEGSVAEWGKIVMDEDNFTSRNLVIHYNSKCHTYMEVVNEPIFDGVESTREEVCEVCGHIGKVEKIEFLNQYLAGVTTFNVSLDEPTKYLSANLSAAQNLNESITVIAGYTLNTIPNSFNFYGTGSKVQVLDENGVQIDEYTLVVRGDVNGDSVCDVLDLMLIELARSNNATLEGAYFSAGDLAENGQITGDDFEAIVNKVKAG